MYHECTCHVNARSNPRVRWVNGHVTCWVDLISCSASSAEDLSLAGGGAEAPAVRRARAGRAGCGWSAASGRWASCVADCAGGVSADGVKRRHELVASGCFQRQAAIVAASN